MIDLKRQEALREAIELFYFGYCSFTSRPDRILAQRGLSRVHHRVLYFVGRKPDLSVNELLDILGVTKQALNAPLRQLIEMRLIAVCLAKRDRRVKQLRLTREGEQLESRLTGTQMKHLAAAFEAAGDPAEMAWRRVMKELPESD